jgi:hypothetical protein
MKFIFLKIYYVLPYMQTNFIFTKPDYSYILEGKYSERFSDARREIQEELDLFEKNRLQSLKMLEEVEGVDMSHLYNLKTMKLSPVGEKGKRKFSMGEFQRTIRRKK